MSDEALRIVIFLTGFVVLGLAEAQWPRRPISHRWQRWSTNIALIALGTLAVRLLIPVLTIAAASVATQKNWGLLHHVDAPTMLEVIVAVILLDMAIYWQHVASHRLPWLWSIHRVHHCDRDIDVSTGLRFHPIEIVLSMAYKLLVIAALGAPLVSVVIFEVLLNLGSLFSHANIKIRPLLDRMLRRLIVTPDMHRVHHSIIPSETNSNYGFCLSLWDRIFGSYCAQPQKGHEAMTLGLSSFQDERTSKLGWSLLLPLQRDNN